MFSSWEHISMSAVAQNFVNSASTIHFHRDCVWVPEMDVCSFSNQSPCEFLKTGIVYQLGCIAQRFYLSIPMPVSASPISANLSCWWYILIYRLSSQKICVGPIPCGDGTVTNWKKLCWNSEYNTECKLCCVWASLVNDGLNEII